jgi:hypothetical protein
MSFGVFALLFFGGAGLLAAWISVRFRRWAPDTLRGALVHQGVSLVCCQLIIPLIASSVDVTSNAELRLAVLMLVALPAIVYAMMSLIWLISVIQSALHRGMLR